ncbi:MAG: hypothetical protein U1E77_11475 [Inhella sp.]
MLEFESEMKEINQDALEQVVGGADLDLGIVIIGGEHFGPGDGMGGAGGGDSEMGGDLANTGRRSRIL